MGERTVKLIDCDLCDREAETGKDPSKSPKPSGWISLVLPLAIVRRRRVSKKSKTHPTGYKTVVDVLPRRCDVCPDCLVKLQAAVQSCLTEHKRAELSEALLSRG